MIILDTTGGALIAAAAIVLAAVVGVGGAYVTRKAFPREAVLQIAGPRFEARLRAYSALLPLLEFGPDWAPDSITPTEREARLDAIRAWYYEPGHGGGLLLGGDAHRAFVELLAKLRETDPTAEEIRKLASRFRTELRIDLNVRQPGERGNVLPSSEELAAWS